MRSCTTSVSFVIAHTGCYIWREQLDCERSQMGWFESLQRVSRVRRWLPSAIVDADSSSSEEPKASGLLLPPSDHETGIWYPCTGDDTVAQSAWPADVSTVALHCLTNSSFYLCVLFYMLRFRSACFTGYERTIY